MYHIEIGYTIFSKKKPSVIVDFECFADKLRFPEQQKYRGGYPQQSISVKFCFKL